MTGASDPYKVLQVDSEAEDEVIQAAYRRLAQKYHPDVAAGPEAFGRMSAINAAWEVLRDPTRRAAHDLARRVAARHAERAAAASPASSTSSGSPAPPGAPGSAAPSGPASSAGGRATGGRAGDTPPRPAETMSTDWTSGRSSQGHGYDPAQMGAPDGLG